MEDFGLVFGFVYYFYGKRCLWGANLTDFVFENFSGYGWVNYAGFFSVSPSKRLGPFVYSMVFVSFLFRNVKAFSSSSTYSWTGAVKKSAKTASASFLAFWDSSTLTSSKLKMSFGLPPNDDLLRFFEWINYDFLL